MSVYTYESYHFGYNEWYELHGVVETLLEAQELQEKAFNYKGRIQRWYKGKVVETWMYENGEVVEHFS
jgi:hypothetical protein